MSALREVKVTPEVLRNLLENDSATCFLSDCREKFKVGDTIVESPFSFKFAHKECYVARERYWNHKLTIAKKLTRHETF